MRTLFLFLIMEMNLAPFALQGGLDGGNRGFNVGASCHRFDYDIEVTERN